MITLPASFPQPPPARPGLPLQGRKEASFLASLPPALPQFNLQPLYSQTNVLQCLLWYFSSWDTNSSESYKNRFPLELAAGWAEDMEKDV